MPCLSYTVGLTLHTIEEVDSQTQFNYSTVDITTLEESPSAPMDVVLEGKDNNTCVEVTSQRGSHWPKVSCFSYVKKMKN